jgi:hypothetical protein
MVRGAIAAAAFALTILAGGQAGAEVLREARRRGLPLLHKPVQVAKLRAVLNHLAAAA